MARTGIWGKLALVRLLERMPAWVRIALSIASIVCQLPVIAAVVMVLQWMM